MSTTRRSFLAAAIGAAVPLPALADDVVFEPMYAMVEGWPVGCVYQHADGSSTWITWVEGKEVERITWGPDGKRGIGGTP